MKLLICFILFSVLSHGQVVKYQGEKYLEFTLKYATDTTTLDGIDWQKENLVSEFILKGVKPLKYSIQIINDSLVTLSQYENDLWIFQESINITGWALRKVENSKILSEFKITDFDRDGNEDFNLLD